MSAVKKIVAILVFLALFLGIFSLATDLLMHKQIEGRWNMTTKILGFYNLPPESLDVVFLGSSHMYCSVDPVLLEKATGLQSYVFATQQQPLWITYHYMQEALKTQTPRLVVVEVHMAGQRESYMDEGTNHTAIDPVPFSKNKVQMIRASVPKGERRYYLFSLMKYHDRWEELEQEDYEFLHEKGVDPNRGYVRLTEAAIDIEQKSVSDTTQVAVANEKNVVYIDKIIDLAEERGIRLLLFKAPSNASEEEKMWYNAVARQAEGRNVPFIDYNEPELYREIGLSLTEDFYDERHLNERGMEKFLAHFGSVVETASVEDNGNL